MEFLKDIGLSFIPLCVAIDALGNIPFILSMTQDMNPEERPKVIRYAMITGFLLGLGFLGIGEGVFGALGIDIADFLVAGGAILLVLSIRHLMTGKFVELQPTISKAIIGVVPIGTPLVVGPATLTTLLLQGQIRSIPAVMVAFILNMILAWAVFGQSNRISRFLHEQGLRAASQIASLLLAAIAVMMVRKGITQMLG